MKYSVVIPLKDEESNIEKLVDELEPVMNKLGRPWELILVDDGSTDSTPQILKALAQEKNTLRVLTFDCNYGQTSAFDAGFKECKGEIVITLDGDRQNNPADIPLLLERLEGCDLVCGERIARRDPPAKKIISSLAKFVRRAVLKDPIRDTGCSLKVYRASCLKRIPLFDGMHRFLPALFVIYGYKVDQMPVDHRERTAGKSKYNFFNRSFNTISDLLAVLWMSRRALRYKLRSSP
ncbi:MAG: glycosyltransferase family 2 protein [Chlamydiia bacterium]|nr:glycosyltransferase family 2 protein [Chlamydiia bacterium]